MTKATTRAGYTLESKQEAVRLVEGGQIVKSMRLPAAASIEALRTRSLFVSDQLKENRATRSAPVDDRAVIHINGCLLRKPRLGCGSRCLSEQSLRAVSKQPV